MSSERGVNVLVPHQEGIITRELMGEGGQKRITLEKFLMKAKMPWVHLLVYAVLRFLQGAGGLIGVIRSWAWLPLSQVLFPISIS